MVSHISIRQLLTVQHLSLFCIMQRCLLRKTVDRQEKCEAAGNNSFRPYRNAIMVRLSRGLMSLSEQHFPTVKSFRVTGG